MAGSGYVRAGWLLLPLVVALVRPPLRGLRPDPGNPGAAPLLGLLFAVVLGPMMLFGCAYYPWVGLSAIGPAQYLFLLNPLTFMSEAMRLAVTPESPHMPVPLLLGGLLGFLGVLPCFWRPLLRERTIL